MDVLVEVNGIKAKRKAKKNASRTLRLYDAGMGKNLLPTHKGMKPRN